MANEQIASADIHHFYPHPLTGEVSYDEDGDPMLGFYFELLDAEGLPISTRVGPYGSAAEAEAACKRAWETNDY